MICTIQSFLPVFLSFSPYKMSQSLKWLAIAYFLVYNFEEKNCGLLIPIGMPCSRGGKIRKKIYFWSRLNCASYWSSSILHHIVNVYSQTPVRHSSVNIIWKVWRTDAFISYKMRIVIDKLCIGSQRRLRHTSFLHKASI